MSLEKNKQTARQFLVAIGKHDGPLFDSLLTEDATYWVQGKPHLFPHAGVKKRAEISAYMHTPSIFKDGLKQKIGEMTAEADRVAMEVEVEGTAPNGIFYNCTYHYLLTFRDGKIAQVKEYLDTAHAIEVFGKK